MKSSLRLRADEVIVPRSSAVGSLQFFLPVHPVPLSACFKSVGKGKYGRAPTGRYLKFQRAVDWHLHHAKVKGTAEAPLFTGPVAVRFIICRPDQKRRDLDNQLKSLGDSLTRNHILKDDRQIVDLRIGWTLEKLEHPVLVQVEAV